ncbi:MAG: mechanosensitive ion channel family protein [Flavobacterium sp.]
MRILPILLAISCFLSIEMFAQDKKIDSINDGALSEYKLIVLSAKTQRINDSIEKVRLEEKIRGLKTTDNLEKKSLQNQLNTLRIKDSIRLVQKKIAIDSRRAAAVGYPVMGFFKDTLFTIYNNSGSFTAHERAIAISERIKTMANKINADSLKIVTNETTVDVMTGERIIISISENDALWNDTSMMALAAKYKKIIGEAVAKYKSETSLLTLAKEFALAVLVLLVLGIIIFYTGKLFTYSAGLIEKQQDVRIKGIKIKDYELFDARRQVSTLIAINNLVKWIVILILISIALPILFGIFPWTRDFAETLFGYILTPIKKIAFSLWNYLPNLITIIVILIAFKYVMKGLKFLKYEVEIGNLKLAGFYPDWANPTYQILRIMVLAFMIVVIFPYLPGSDSPIFKGVSVFLGFLFTFGSAGSLSNMIAGLVLTYMRLFRIGDRVKIGDVSGDVIEKSLLVTRLKTPLNEIISIPNSTVMSSHTINYSLESLNQGLVLSAGVTIGYDVPWKDVHKALLEAADRTPEFLKDPKPFVLQTGLEDFYIGYEVYGYTRAANSQAGVKSLLFSNILDTFNENGIEIMSPHYRANRDGNAITIPTNYQK